ncbi:hypothetical protein GWN26_06855 [Candidatus Saccharibacteria bacterium]|nr:hypothetical protein [Candidatus Saccharibacteria bacterium]
MLKYYISGLVGSIIPEFYVAAFFGVLGAHRIHWEIILPGWLISGLLAGYIGTRFEKKFTGSLIKLSKIGLIALTAILGFITASLIGMLIMEFRG